MQKLASMYPIYNLLHKWKWSREHKLWLIMIDSSWWQTEIMTQRLENYCLVIFLFFSRFATGSCRAVVFRFRGHGFIFNFTAFFNCFLFISFDFLLLFLFILLYLRPWTDISLLEVSHMSTKNENLREKFWSTLVKIARNSLKCHCLSTCDQVTLILNPLYMRTLLPITYSL